MKKNLFMALLAATLLLAAGTVNADSINGRFGVTGKLGFVVPADNESDFIHNRTDTGFIGGGGIIFGIDDHLALSAEATRSSFGSETGDFRVTDVSFGGQYRFQPRARLVPYLGAGIDILASDYSPYDGHIRDVDTTLGAHVAGGLDFFVHRQVALSWELKGVLAPNTDITNSYGDHVGNFDPSSFSGTFGARFFFN